MAYLGVSTQYQNIPEERLAARRDELWRQAWHGKLTVMEALEAESVTRALAIIRAGKKMLKESLE